MKTIKSSRESWFFEDRRKTQAEKDLDLEQKEEKKLREEFQLE